MTTITRRKHTGRPGNGGQFDGKTNSVPEGVLGKTALDPVSAEVTFDWTERNMLLTPRHRVPRDVERKAQTTIEIQSVTGAEAPVGFTVTQNEWEHRDPETGARISDAEARRLRLDNRNLELQPELRPVSRDYRVHGGELYREILDGQRPDNTTPATPDWIATRATRSWKFMCDGDTEDEAARDAQSKFADYLSIDGTLWAKAREPVYQIQTFGLGGNHGSTAITAATAPVTGNHAAESFYFPADAYEAAVAYAVDVAIKRGDTESVARIRKTPHIVVSKPELIAKTWRPATVIPEHPMAYELTPETFRRELAAFRRDIATIPGASEKVEDGFGNPSHRVNYSALSETQEDNYKSYLEYGAGQGLL